VGASAPVVARVDVAGPDPLRCDWRRARARCLREAQRVLRDPLAAEDAVQEAMMRAWRQRDSCQRPESPMAWMVQITRNEALRRLGRDRLQTDHELAGEEHAGEHSPLETRLEVLDLRHALAVLTAEERALLTLRYGADLTQPDIARMLDLPEGTVKVRLFRARKRIRQAMERPS
jgi:RNA polymerase sigma-70 factor (ECF subfamily)